MHAPRLTRRALVQLAAGAGLTLVLGGVAHAEDEPTVAQTDDFAKALPLDRAYSGHLAAGRGGHFAYYKFFYAADGSTATVNVQVYPDDAVVLKNVGMKIFGPRPNKEYVNGGQTPGVRPNVSGNVISQDPNDRGWYTVQLYNWDLNAAVDYTIAAQGAAVPPTVAAPAEAPAPAAPTNTSGDAAAAFGSAKLEGVLAPGGGDFRYYRFDYPGKGAVVSVNMQVSPDESLLLQNVGFRIYGPKEAVGPLFSGVRQGLVPNVSRDVIDQEPGSYVVQLYNYDPIRPVPFQVWATGLPEKAT
jgi:hypothetical protein